MIHRLSNLRLVCLVAFSFVEVPPRDEKTVKERVLCLPLVHYLSPLVHHLSLSIHVSSRSPSRTQDSFSPNLPSITDMSKSIEYRLRPCEPRGLGKSTSSLLIRKLADSDG